MYLSLLEFVVLCYSCKQATPTNKDKGLQGGQYARTEEELYKKALAVLEKCRIAPGRSGQEISELESAT
jgi:hypothetical protein